ncbi:hypothetical protein LZC95_43650 [Pendulispora brunnea]|uniref:Desulfoferrodoxin ferrous iron-binding domain-containing protein n=1 Tax=Pendulispora brunnea TaxID=2905690 RepID=A0ABZ2K7U0_9BACT
MARPTEPTLTRRAFFGGSVGLGLGALGIARFLAACSTKSSSLGGDYTDGDEYIPGGNAGPAVDGEEFSAERRAKWEALVRELESLGPVYTAAAPGKWAGKERSHVPQVEVQDNVVTVLVEHMMSIPPLDAGTGGGYDAGGRFDAGGGFDADIDEDAGVDLDADIEEDAGRGGGGRRDGGRRDAGIDKDAGDRDSGVIDAGLDIDGGEQGLHYVTTIYLKNENGEVVGLREFRPLDPAPPKVNFRLPQGVKSVTAHEHCTLHGVWAADPVNVG